MTNEQLERVNEGVRQCGIDYLHDLATNDPRFFLDLIGHVLEPDQRPEQQQPPTGPVRFVYTQQPDSNNRT